MICHEGESVSLYHDQSDIKAPLVLLVATCSLYIKKLPQSVPVGPPWSSISYVNWELSWWDNHLSVTWLSGLIPSGPVVFDGL